MRYGRADLKMPSICNTGKPYPADGQPTTFHPDYVQRGIAYGRKFPSTPYALIRCRDR